GAIAYRMAAKRAPFNGTTVGEILSSRAKERLVPLAEAAGLGASAVRFCAVIDRLLVADREQRCSSAGWVAHALRVAVKSKTIAGDEGATLTSEGFAAPSAAAKATIVTAHDTIETPKVAAFSEPAISTPQIIETKALVEPPAPPPASVAVVAASPVAASQLIP